MPDTQGEQQTGQNTPQAPAGGLPPVPTARPEGEQPSGSSTPSTPAPQPPAQSPAAPLQPPQPAQTETAPTPTPPSEPTPPSPSPLPPPPNTFASVTKEPEEAAFTPSSEPIIAWDASEYVHHTKGPMWYLGFAAFAVTIIAIGIFLLKDWFSTIVFGVMVVAIAVVATRAPRTLRYEISQAGVTIGEKLYTYDQFQSFGVLQDGALWNILLMPTARFRPPITIYFDEAHGEKIVDTLGQFLPMEEHKPDFVDRLSSKIRF